MEQVVTQLAEAHSVDLSQAGAQLRLDMPTGPDRWMVANLSGEIVLARGFEQEDGVLSPDLDMAFGIREVGGFDAPDDRISGGANDLTEQETPHDQLESEQSKFYRFDFGDSTAWNQAVTVAEQLDFLLARKKKQTKY